MQKFALVVLPLFFFSSLSYGNYCDNLYEEMQPKLEALKRVVGCSSGFTATECRENLGYGTTGIAATVAIAAGYKSGRHMILKVPRACGIRGADNFMYDLLFPYAHAACESPTSVLVKELEGILDDDLKIKQYQVVKELQGELEKDKVLTGAVAEYEKMKQDYFGNKAQRDSVPVRLTEFKNKYGIEDVSFTNATYCKGNPRFCEKFRTLLVLRQPVEATRNAIAHFDEIYNIFRDDPNFKDKFTPIKNVQAIKRKIANGLVKTYTDLGSLFEEVGKTVHPGFHERFATAVTRALKAFPNLKDLLKMTATLGESFTKFMAGKQMGKVKFTLPAILGILLASGASAAECSEQGLCQNAKKAVENGVALMDAATDPAENLRIKSLGCTEIYSEYSTINEDCKDTPAFTGKMTTFLVADPETQKQELCRHPKFLMTVKNLHAETYPSNIQITCDTNGVTLKYPRQGTTTRFTFNNDQLVKTQVSGKFEGNYGYDLDFNGDGTIRSAKINTQPSGRTGFYFDTAKIKGSAAVVEPLTEDLSPRMPLAFASWEGCKTKRNPSGSSTVTPATSGRGVK